MTSTVTLNPGALIFVKGKSLRSWLSRTVFLRAQYNHVYVALNSRVIFDLSFKGVKLRLFDEVKDKNIVIVEPEWFSQIKGTGVLEMTAVLAYHENRLVRFSWKEYWLRALGIVPREKRTNQLCHFWAESILHKFVAPSSREKMLPDIMDIMCNDYTSRQLNARYGLVKVYDYRGKP